RLFDPTVKHFSAKNFTDLRLADCLFNQHTEKTQKNVWIFLCHFPFSSPLSARQEHTFPARESILFSPGNDTPLSPRFIFFLSRHQRTYGRKKNTPGAVPWMRH
ncbi:hypothetical protein, partial [Desulfovibrio sp.]|uniref:hypothetical protein n=1 Tax=Desulfovibrio sp. TaxID=885 RepID=UPI00307808F4